MREYYIGVDVGGSSIKFGRFDLTGVLQDQWSIRTDKRELGELILIQIAHSIAKKVPFEKIKGIGFGVPGPVTNNIVLSCVNLGWQRKNVEEEFRSMIKDDDIVIKVGNDATVAAAGELYQGVAKGYTNMVLYTLGTGVGGGVILNNHLIEGFNGVSGELGHIRVDYNHEFKCNCGKVGCLETVSSATGIVNLARDFLATSDLASKLRNQPYLSAKKVIDAAKEGDVVAYHALDEAMMYLAQAMAQITFSINPEIIVIGGGVSNAGTFLIELIEKHYYEMVKPFISHTNFAIASLGNDAGIYGCCFMVKQ